MNALNRPLSKSEREELARIVSPASKVTRAVLWLLFVAVAALVPWNINQKTGGATWWPLPAAVVGLLAYFVGGRMSGGRGLRSQVQDDLRKGEAEERLFEITAAAFFPEVEDEGPVVFLLSGDSVYCLSGQRVGRLVRDGTMASQLVESLAPVSRRVLGLRSRGERLTLQRAEVTFAQSEIFGAVSLRPFVAEVSLSWAAVVAALKKKPEKDRAEDE